MNGTVITELSEFVATADVPDRPRHAARRTIANAACLVVGSASSEAVRIAAAAVEPLQTAARATVLGRRTTASVPWAGFLMGIAAHVEDFDDTHLKTIIHPGATVPPAALAMAEWLDRDTVELADAVAMGVEVMLRIGKAMCPDHFQRGWHVTATLGHVGSAAACARLLGLDAARTANAVGLSLLQAGGVQAVLGTMVKAFHPGRAALNGSEATLLASRGWTAPDDALEGPGGYASAHSTEPALTEVTTQLGTHWELESNAFKPYACGVVAHPLIDAGIVLRERFHDSSSIATIEVDANPWVLVAMGLEQPQHGLESKFSAYHAMAAAFLHGRAGPREFSDEVVLGPEIRDLRGRITINADEAVPRDAAVVRVIDVAGRSHHLRIEHATGSVERPMTDNQLRDKGRRELSRTLDDAAVTRLLDALYDEGHRPVRDLARLALPRP